MWDKLRDNVKQWRAEFERLHKVAIHLNVKDIKQPSKFAEFTVAVGKLIYNLFETWGLPKSSPNQCYYIVFDGAEHLYSLDPTLVENLARLAKVQD